MSCNSCRATQQAEGTRMVTVQLVGPHRSYTLIGSSCSSRTGVSAQCCPAPFELSELCSCSHVHCAHVWLNPKEWDTPLARFSASTHFLSKCYPRQIFWKHFWSSAWWECNRYLLLSSSPGQASAFSFTLDNPESHKRKTAQGIITSSLSSSPSLL